MADGLKEIYGWWHINLWVPGRFQKYFGCRQIQLSLHTKDKGSAERKLKIMMLELNDIYERLDNHAIRPYLSDREIAMYISKFKPSKGKRVERITMKQAAEKFEANNAAAWTPKTKQEAMSAINYAAKWFGLNRPVADIDRDDCEEYKRHIDTLRKYGKPTENIIDVVTKNKYLSRLYSLLKVEFVAGTITSNPAEALAFKTSGRTRANQMRKPLELEDVRLVVDKVLERDGLRPSMFWVPLIALLGGMRRSEACQLYKKDIVVVKGIPCMFVVDDEPDKHLKTPAAARYVPIHSRLIEMGFLKYVDALTTDRLFPELTHHRDGYGHSFKRFMPSFRLNVSKDPLKVFHSTRHTVGTILHRAGIDELTIADALGHERPGLSEASKTYIKEALTPKIKEVIELIDYPGIDWPVCPFLKETSAFEEIIITKLPHKETDKITITL